MNPTRRAPGATPPGSRGMYVPHPVYGRGLLGAVKPQRFEAPIVLTQPEPWELVAQAFDPARTQVHHVRSMDLDNVEARTRDFGEPASAVFGIGGGSALDHAKFTAWRLGVPLILMPSILSVDAAYTRSVGVREGRRVRYVGDARPDALLVDYDLLQAAPKLLNRAGAGDVLSCFTALWDWRESNRRTGERFDEGVAAEAAQALDRLMAHAEQLGVVSEEGLQLLSDLYVLEVALCERWGNSRPEEGSEHHLCYALEALTGDHYVHGQLVALCVLIAGTLQGQDLRPVVRALRALQLDPSPGAVGVTREALVEALVGVHAYVTEEAQLLPGVFHFHGPIARGEASALVDEAVGLLG